MIPELEDARIICDRELYYKEGYKYGVSRPVHFIICIPLIKEVDLPFAKIDKFGNGVILPGYAWNGASGPTWDTKSSMIASLIHDLLYQLIRLGYIDEVYKPYADKWLHDLCTRDGMYSWRADYWRWAVLNFGESSCRPSAEPPELVAP